MGSLRDSRILGHIGASWWLGAGFVRRRTKKKQALYTEKKTLTSQTPDKPALLA